VLPQGMKNSPSICQWYVAQILSPVRERFPDAMLYHYMDDILVRAEDECQLELVLTFVIRAIQDAGFVVAPEKIQHQCPVTYLGLKIKERTIVPQQFTTLDNPQTLQELQHLCGSISWVRPLLGISTEDLAPLFNRLCGDSGLSSPCQLTPAAREALGRVQEALTSCRVHQVDPELPYNFSILGELPHLHRLIFQWDGEVKDPLLIVEWVFLPHQPSKTTTRPQELVAQLIRKPRNEELEFLMETSECLQFTLDSFSGKLSSHYPAHKLFSERFKLAPKVMRSAKPLDALMIFTDGSGVSHKSVMTWRDPQTSNWEKDVQVVEGSPQIAELATVVTAFERFPDRPINIVTDSAYMAGVVERAEHVLLKEVSNPRSRKLLSELIHSVSHRKQPYYVMHVRSHTDLPGPITEGNRRADALAAPVTLPAVPGTFQQAKLSHQLYHQNVPALVRMFHITRDQAKAIVATRPSCQKHEVPSLGVRVNPWGLQSCQLWHTDVTHVQEFGRSKYVHISIDTFSGAVLASAHGGEKAKDVKRHFFMAFSTLGVPAEIKTDNGPAYVSRDFMNFFDLWGIRHTTGIPHSPTGQSVVERAHLNIKRVLAQQ
ncbi:POK11 protein, partial [Melanocharis versteri]|nr:POK11 protein [Melanocharis versteri]